MKIREALTAGIGHLQANRRRAGLSILGIFIGIASVLCMMAIGSISAYATITVDVDRPLENLDDDWWKIQPNGVDYSAYANIYADASTGSWSVSATVPGDMDGLSGVVNGDTYREASASNFDWILGDPGHVEDHLGNAFSSGTVSIPGFRSEARAEDFGTIGNL